ncbi:MAG: hypothetical protein IPN29_07665 [Saprospiraceae bacterium]|nr:hypothetical protein [Saprospiraceae bacterium]
MIDLDEILKRIQQQGLTNLEDINKALSKEMNAHNSKGLEQFDGLSPDEMHILQRDVFGPESKVRLQKLNEEELNQIPMLHMVVFLLNKVKTEGRVKLTPKGNLPVSIVKELYALGHIKDVPLEDHGYKCNKQEDSYAVNVCAHLIQVAGLVKSIKGHISLSALGEKAIQDRNDLLQIIFKTHCMALNWAYFDNYESDITGQLAAGYSLLLLSRYGDAVRPLVFYGDKYFTALPMLIDEFEDRYFTKKRAAYQCYTIRTFERFLAPYGLIEMEKKNTFLDSDTDAIKIKPLFHQFISVDSVTIKSKLKIVR